MNVGLQTPCTLPLQTHTIHRFEISEKEAGKLTVCSYVNNEHSFNAYYRLATD